MLRNATPLRKSAPGPPNISDGTCLLHCVCHGKCIFADLLQMSYACRRFWKCYKTLTFFSYFWQGAQSLAPATRNDIWTSKSGPSMWSQLPKVVRSWCVLYILTSTCLKVVRAWRVLYILTSTCASRHNGVHFFDISISKSCAFWLRNVLRATAACIFSSLIWPAGSAPAALASLLFDPLEPQIIGKTQCFATFPPFRAPASSFFWLFLFSDLLSSALLFSILLLHLCFSSVHTVGSLNFLRLYV